MTVEIQEIKTTVYKVAYNGKTATRQRKYNCLLWLAVRILNNTMFQNAEDFVYYEFFGTREYDHYKELIIQWLKEGATIPEVEQYLILCQQRDNNPSDFWDWANTARAQETHDEVKE